MAQAQVETKKMKKSNTKTNEAKTSEHKKYFLSKEERLGLQNTELQRQLIDTRVKNELQRLEIEQQQYINDVEARIGISLKDYSVNMATGELTEKPKQEN